MLIVAVHDVAPSTLRDVRWLLARLDDAGVARRVLKVIPAEPGAGAAGTAEMASLMTDEVGNHAEIVLHGWSHRQEGAPRGGFGDRLGAAAFAGGAAEFLSLSPA